ncbi:hypothetical protein [Streptomyces sp. NPDC019507]|uniref:hypothetical protein n=1 Tax=Streptomyces sp. NPDC019507 TaxID=3154689 RepID=UPI0033EF5AF1
MTQILAPNMTEADIADLRALRGTGQVTDAFLVRLAEHFLTAEIEGVLNPARHLAEYLDVERQTVLTYMRMARNRGLVVRH